LFFFDRGRRTSVHVFSVVQRLVDGGIFRVPRVGVPATADRLHPGDQVPAAGHDVRTARPEAVAERIDVLAAGIGRGGGRVE
jgi:hypothetical protein